MFESHKRDNHLATNLYYGDFGRIGVHKEVPSLKEKLMGIDFKESFLEASDPWDYNLRVKKSGIRRTKGGRKPQIKDALEELARSYERLSLKIEPGQLGEASAKRERFFGGKVNGENDELSANLSKKLKTLNLTDS